MTPRQTNVRFIASRRRVFHRPVSGHQRRIREIRPRDRPPGAVDRRAAADRVRRPRRRCSASSRRRTSGRTDSRRPDTAAIRSCSSAMTMRWRTATGCRTMTGMPFGCRPKRSGKRRRAAESKALAIRGATTFDPSRGNYLADPAVKRQRGTRPTGTYPPNAYGLCDMIGNVWEWVSDWYSADTTAWATSAIRAGPHAGSHADRARRLLGQRRCLDAALCVPAQGAARHVRLQHRIPDRMRSVDSAGEPAVSSLSRLRRQP